MPTIKRLAINYSHPRGSFLTSIDTVLHKFFVLWLVSLGRCSYLACDLTFSRCSIFKSAHSARIMQNFSGISREAGASCGEFLRDLAGRGEVNVGFSPQYFPMDTS